MLHGFVCRKVTDHHQRIGLGQTTSSVSVNLGMFNAPRNQRFRICSARGEPVKRPKQWLQRIEAAIAALGDDDGEELATLQSCLRHARLHGSERLQVSQRSRTRDFRS